MLSWCKFVMEKNTQGNNASMVLHSSKTLSQHLHWLTSLCLSHGALNTQKKSKNFNYYSVTQTYRVIQMYYGKRAAFPKGLWCPAAQKSQVHPGCRLCLCWRAEPPENSDGIALTVSQICCAFSSAIAILLWWQMLRLTGMSIHFFTCISCVTAGGISSVIIHPILLLCHRFTSVCYQNMPKTVFHALEINAEWNVNTSR